jgi:phage/plasmid-associated DNA primase
VKRLACDLNKPKLFDDYVNMSGEFKHKKDKRYDDCSENAKHGVKLLLNHIHEVISSSKKDQSEYLTQWLAYAAKGGKNKTIPYLRSKEQGTGKSTITDCIIAHVLGRALCISTGSKCLKTNFNSILCGKLLVVFEELETTSVSEWSSISSKLKRMATADTDEYESKGINAWIAENFNNYMILSNNDAIRDDNGRRYTIFDISLHRMGDVKYFDELYKYCFNDECGEAFFLYLLQKVDLTKYDHTKALMTSNKVDSIVKRLPSVNRFVKDTYVLTKTNMYGTVQEVYNKYVDYCDKEKPLCKIEFNKSLTDLNIVRFGSGATNKYDQKFLQLYAVAMKHGWIHETDDFVHPETEIQVVVKEKPIKIVKPVEIKVEVVDPIIILDLPHRTVSDKDKLNIIKSMFYKPKKVIKVKQNSAEIDMHDAEVQFSGDSFFSFLK